MLKNIFSSRMKSAFSLPTHPLPIEDIAIECSKRPDDPKKIVELLLTQSVYHTATDVHMDNINGRFKICFRIRGKLHTVASYELVFAKKIITALKEKANIAITASGAGTLQTGTCTITSSHTNIPVYIIPFNPLESIVIHLPNEQGAINRLQHTSQSSTPDLDKKIFIWQMGKVGSSSIYNSLKPITRPVTWDVSSIVTDDHWLVHNNVLHTHSAQILFNFLHATDEEFVVISLVRDLLARNISSIFESMCHKMDWNTFFIADENEFRALPYEIQEEEILKKLRILNQDEQLTNFYNNLFKSHFYYPDTDRYLIDIFSKPFDFEKGFQTYRSNTPRIKMIIIRLEDMNNLEKKIGNFLGINNFYLLNNNLSNDKWYKPIYKKFLRRYTPLEEEIKKIYQSHFMNYFYSPHQINNFIKYWSNK